MKKCFMILNIHFKKEKMNWTQNLAWEKAYNGKDLLCDLYISYFECTFSPQSFFGQTLF